LKRHKGQRGQIELVSWASKGRGFRSRSLVEVDFTALRNARGGDVCVVLDAPAAPARVADPDPFARARYQ